MKSVYLLFLLFIATAISAQTIKQREVVKDSAYMALYGQMKELRVKRLNSLEYKQYTQLRNAYNDKIIRKYDEPQSGVGTKEWLTDNWKYKTKFLSYESALRAYEAVTEAGELIYKNELGYKDLMIKSVKSYGPHLLIEIEEEIRKLEYPDLD